MSVLGAIRRTWFLIICIHVSTHCAYCDIFQEVHFLKVNTGGLDVVIDLKKMLDIDQRSGKTSTVQRIKKISNIGKTFVLQCFSCAICTHLYVHVHVSTYIHVHVYSEAYEFGLSTCVHRSHVI